MANYKWLTLSDGDESKAKPVFAFISPANGFYGPDGQQLIKTRLELLTRLGFEVKIPVFSLDAAGGDIYTIPEKINFDIAEQKAAFGQMQVVVEPNVVGRNEPKSPEPDRNANSPQTGANIIKDCINNGWNMMPLMGGSSFDDKIPYIKQYFKEHPEEKNPEVKIFGYSNITFANSLMLDGICSYCPTPFTNFFSKVVAVTTKKSQRALSEGETEWLAFLESQATKLKAALINPASVSNGKRKVIFYPQTIPENLEGTSMHYPLNADVFTGLKSAPEVFVPNPSEKWSFAIEWMIQNGNNPANISKAFEMLDEFLLSNTQNPPQFIELGVLGTRFDGMNGVWDLIYDEDGRLGESDANVDIILFRDSTKHGFVKKLNDFLTGYKSCGPEDKNLNGSLPTFLSSKLDHDFNKISEVDGSISREEIKDVFRWRNEVCERVVGKVSKIAEKYNLPLVFNPNYGHVANMSPNIAGPCEYRFDGPNLNLGKLADRSLTASSEKKFKWRFFYNGPEGKIMCSSTKPEALNAVAILTTSLYFASNVSTKMGNQTRKALEFAHQQFCIALPCGNEEVANEVRAVVPSDFQDIITFDVNNESALGGAGIGFMTPHAGALQIISAIENGFDIHCQAGGVQLGGKIELVRQYFRENPLPSDRKKSIIVGFSDGSEAQFGFSELTEYVHTAMAGRAWTDAPHLIGEKDSMETVAKIFAARDSLEITRNLQCETPETANDVHRRYDVNDGKKIRCLTYFPRQLISAIDSPYRPYFEENLILCLEGYAQSERGYNAHEALEVALSQGVFDPQKIIAVVVEDIVIKEDEMGVRRINGKIPDYETLTEKERTKILTILRENNSGTSGNEEEVRGYIVRANVAYSAEVERIKQVAADYGIPVLLGGEKRAGHAYDFVTQPSTVTRLNFNGATIEMISQVRNNELVQEIAQKIPATAIEEKRWRNSNGIFAEEDSAIYPHKKVPMGYEYSKETPQAIVQSPQFNEKISCLKIFSLNEAARNLASNPAILPQDAEIFAGNSGNISERNLEEINGKGLLCIMPYRPEGKGVHQSFDIIKLINSGRIGASDVVDEIPGYQPQFVILAAQDPAQNFRLAAVVKNLNPQTAIFIAENDIAQVLGDPSKPKAGQLSGLPNIFTARINLRQILSPERSVSATTIDPLQQRQAEELDGVR